MNKQPGKTPASRLVTGVCVLFACFLAVGIWRATSFLLHKNSAPPPAPTFKAEPLATPAPKPLAPAPPKDKNALLVSAVKAEDAVVVKALLERGANPNVVIVDKYIDWNGAHGTDSTTLLEWAVSKGSVEIVKSLLRHGAEVNSQHDVSPLSEAARNGDLKMATLLLRYGAEVNPKGQQSPLAWASYVGPDALPMMKLLIRHGADVNAHFEHGGTVMTIARFHSGDEAVALLRRHGARR